MANSLPISSPRPHLPTQSVKDEEGKLQQKRLKDAAAQFEALFIKFMLQVMRNSSAVSKQDREEGSLWTSGWDSPYQDFFDWELAVRLAQKSPLGVAEQLWRLYSSRMISLPSLERTSPNTFTQKVASEATRPNIVNSSSNEGKGGRLRKEKLPPTSLTDSLRAWDGIIVEAAGAHNIDPDLVRAIILVESGGDPYAVSPRGAKGLMQIMDKTATLLGLKRPFHPRDNIFGGVLYLKRLLDRYQGDVELSLAAYNAGPGNVDRYGGVPPFLETREYVRKVKDLYQRIKALNAASPASSPSRETISAAPPSSEGYPSTLTEKSTTIEPSLISDKVSGG